MKNNNETNKNKNQEVVKYNMALRNGQLILKKKKNKNKLKEIKKNN
jgi:hypothetical protein